MLRIHLFGSNPYESIYGLESENISFFAIEYEYNKQTFSLQITDLVYQMETETRDPFIHSSLLHFLREAQPESDV